MKTTLAILLISVFPVGLFTLIAWGEGYKEACKFFAVLFIIIAMIVGAFSGGLMLLHP